VSEADDRPYLTRRGAVRELCRSAGEREPELIGELDGQPVLQHHGAGHAHHHQENGGNGDEAGQQPGPQRQVPSLGSVLLVCHPWPSGAGGRKA
jgi:hypothetical protein